MDQNTTERLSEILRTAAKSHPLFASMDTKQIEDVSQKWADVTRTVLASGTPWADWYKTWIGYQSDMSALFLSGLAGSQTDDTARRDARFKDEAWEEGIYPFLRKSYELTSKAMIEMADKVGLPEDEQRKLSFYARVTADNLSPSNFLATNPEVLKLAQETRGQSLIDGFENMLEDLQKGYITTTDEATFKVGENLANTPGAVVFRNKLIEVIQYTPITDEVRAQPVLIVPPCVNKFYIFDINEKKSMVQYLLEQNCPVFVISWRNAGPDTLDYDWDDYITHGIMSAMEATAEISGSDKVDLLSWCNGGTLLLAALAVMPEPEKSLVGSATFLSSLLDFSDPGEVEVFIDQPQLEAYKKRLDLAKVAPGRDIGRAMAMLHVNESIWGFVVNNYLKGRNPAPFDILYWNADTSNLPAKWFTYFLEEMYLADKLKTPGALTLLDTPVDCGNIDVPCCFVAATGDHIVPWKTSFSSAGLLPNVTEFILTSGGHVSGTVINHPTGNRRHFMASGNRSLSPEEWLVSAERSEGSWWPHWIDWLDKTSGAKLLKAKRKLGSRTHPELSPAPGTYVLEMVEQDGLRIERSTGNE